MPIEYIDTLPPGLVIDNYAITMILTAAVEAAAAGAAAMMILSCPSAFEFQEHRTPTATAYAAISYEKRQSLLCVERRRRRLRFDILASTNMVDVHAPRYALSLCMCVSLEIYFDVFSYVNVYL